MSPPLPSHQHRVTNSKRIHAVFLPPRVPHRPRMAAVGSWLLTWSLQTLALAMKPRFLSLLPFCMLSVTCSALVWVLSCMHLHMVYFVCPSVSLWTLDYVAWSVRSWCCRVLSWGWGGWSDGLLVLISRPNGSVMRPLPLGICFRFCSVFFPKFIFASLESIEGTVFRKH